jgi:hypothetical protein
VSNGTANPITGVPVAAAGTMPVLRADLLADQRRVGRPDLQQQAGPVQQDRGRELVLGDDLLEPGLGHRAGELRSRQPPLLLEDLPGVGVDELCRGGLPGGEPLHEDVPPVGLPLTDPDRRSGAGAQQPDHQHNRNPSPRRPC